MKNLNDLMLKTNNDLLENINKIKELYIYFKEDYEDSLSIKFMDKDDKCFSIEIYECILFIKEEIIDEYAGEFMEDIIKPVELDIENKSLEDSYNTIMQTVNNFLNRFRPKKLNKKNNIKGYGKITKKHLKNLYENPKVMFQQEDRLICDLLSNIRKMQDTNKTETIETAYDILTTHCKDNFLEILHYIKLFDTKNEDVY